MSDILARKNKLQQKENTINENERELSFNGGFFYYLQQSHLVYECKIDSFNFDNKKILKSKSTGIFSYSDYYIMKGIEDTKRELPRLKDDKKMYVYLQGSHFRQNTVIVTPNKNNVINIYVVYKLDPIASSRDDTFTLQNALFGAMQITKNGDTSKYNYKGYGICFDEGGTFGHTTSEGGFAHNTNARNVLIFGVDMSFSVHAANRSNHIYVMCTKFVQGINDTTIYAEKTFVETLQILVKNLC